MFMLHLEWEKKKICTTFIINKITYQTNNNNNNKYHSSKIINSIPYIILIMKSKHLQMKTHLINCSFQLKTKAKITCSKINNLNNKMRSKKKKKLMKIFKKITKNNKISKYSFLKIILNCLSNFPMIWKKRILCYKSNFHSAILMPMLINNNKSINNLKTLN